MVRRWDVGVGYMAVVIDPLHIFLESNIHASMHSYLCSI